MVLVWVFIFLLILTAEKGFSETELTDLMSSAKADQWFRHCTFVRDLEGFERFYWGEGGIYVSDELVWLDGSIAPGPGYRLYLTKGQYTTREVFVW